MPLFGKPKYATVKTKSGSKGPKGDWIKCKECLEFVNNAAIIANLNICPKCDYHYPLTAKRRIELIVDKGTFKEMDSKMSTIDILRFKGYEAKLEANKAKTKLHDAVVCGLGMSNKRKIAIAVMDFSFRGGSMGSVVGEKITKLVEKATEEQIPLLIVTASGGARMQEGCLSLMQMAKTSGALARYAKLKVPYICLLSNPTTGGVTASFASLGDIILAEPKALIGFAGARVIENTIKEKLPVDFQTAEFLEKKGLVDRIVHRRNIKEELGLLLGFFTATPAEKA